jgi:hypothetical protein
MSFVQVMSGILQVVGTRAGAITGAATNKMWVFVALGRRAT